MRRDSACLRILLCALAPLCLPAGAMAQLRSVTVPAESGVVVPPRGQAQPRLVAPPTARAAAPQAAAAEAAEGPAPVQLPAGGTGLAGPLGAVLPLAAAALLGGSLAGGGSGGGGATATTTGLAPARTSR